MIAADIVAWLLIASIYTAAAFLIVQHRPRRAGRIPADFDLAAAIARTRRVAYGQIVRGRVL